MSGFDASASARFFRPSDPGRIRRNQRRLQVQRTVVVLRNTLVVASVVGLAGWGYLKTRSTARFAVSTIEIEGVTHTSQEAIDAVTARYRGANLFQIDLARLRQELGQIAWVRRVDVEKELPGTLRIRVTERTPVALVRRADRLLYADSEGTAFAELAPSVGNDNLPIISEAAGTELVRTIRFLESLRAKDRELYSRVSELWPIPPRGFAMWDRSLGAIIYANEDDGPAKWRNLYAILEAEQHPRIHYADLRFSDRVIVKSIHDTTVAAADAPGAATAPDGTEGVHHAQN